MAANVRYTTNSNIAKNLTNIPEVLMQHWSVRCVTTNILE